MNYQKIAGILTPFRIYGVAFIAMSLGYFLVSRASDVVWVVGGLAISGIGMGLMMPNANFMLLNVLPEKVRGRWLGGLTMSIFLGQFLSPILISPLVTSTSLLGSFMVTSILSAALGIFLIVVKKRQEFSTSAN